MSFVVNLFLNYIFWQALLEEMSNSTIAQETPINIVVEGGGPRETTVYSDMEDFVPQVNILTYFFLNKIKNRHL